MDQRLIPLSDAAKLKLDVAAAGTTAATVFDAIPWSGIAAFLMCVYTALRIIEVLAGWLRKKN